MNLNLEAVAADWRPIFDQCLAKVDPAYLDRLTQTDWLPGPDAIFHAFSLPLAKTQIILFGESPYPRPQSANGYAFWDAAVQDLWSETGLAKPVNRATSLRHLIKMLLVAEGALAVDDTSQEAIAKLDKSPYVSTIDAFFKNLMAHGILLLNASLVLSDNPVNHDAKAWQPFMAELIAQLNQHKPETTLILFGKIAEKINRVEQSQHFNQLVSEHPYNVSFVTNPDVLAFFEPLHLLRK